MNKALGVYLLLCLCCLLVTYLLITHAFVFGKSTGYEYTILMNGRGEWLLETIVMVASLPGVFLIAYQVFKSIRGLF